MRTFVSSVRLRCFLEEATSNGEGTESNQPNSLAMPDKIWGETPCAFVSFTYCDEPVTLREIREFCKTKLPKYMVPRNVVFQEEFPKTSTGKIQKFLLRQMAKSLP